MNKQKGGMYPFVDFTWNTILGKCEHRCKYCYNLGKPFFKGKLRLNEKNLKDNLGMGNFIFVGSSNDLFQESIPKEWILKTLEHCREFDNTYLVQTKNPKRFSEFLNSFPKKIILGTTIETNKKNNLGNAPSRKERLIWMCDVKKPRFVSIEPIMDFDLNDLKSWIFAIKPKFVSIGADSKGHNLLEPSKEKVKALIKELKKFTEVKIKDNLKRIL